MILIKNCVAEEIAEKISKKQKTEIWSVFKTEICDKSMCRYWAVGICKFNFKCGSW